MRRRRNGRDPLVVRGLVLSFALALVLAACGGDDGGGEAAEPAEETEQTEPAEPATTEPEATEPEAEEAPAAGAATIAVADTDLGQVLADGDGAILYGFTNDQGGTSSCYDECATNWPPLLSDAEPMVEGDIDTALLGTTERDDGSTQVTYNDWPLYYFAADEAPGDTAGQAVGDVWWVVDPAGELIME